MVVGLVLNAAGNGLCIVGAMGSGLWTAAAINLNDWPGWNIGAVLFAFGVINALTNLALIHHWDWPRLIGEVIYTLFFSSFVNVFTSVFTWLGLGNWSVLARIFVSCFGVFCFCVAISLYQRANIIMHPNDDTTNILRFMYFKGNATASQITNFIPPIIVAVVAWIATGKLLGINVATLFSFLGNGVIIAWADEHVWPQLKHNFKVTPDGQE